MKNPALALAFLLFLATGASGQDRRVRVDIFDQSQVMSNIDELFGGSYDLGSGIADLLRRRLRERGIETVDGPDAEGVASGSVLVYGREEGRTDVGGVNLGRVRMGLGRRQETAVVVLEARLVDEASGEVLTISMGRGESSKGGMDAFARIRGGSDLGSIDLSSDEFKETSIGEATHKAINELADEIRSAAGRIGTIAVRSAPEPMAPAMPVGGMPAVASGPVGSFAWIPYQFRGTEYFRYDVTSTDGGDVETGFYTLSLQSAGDGRVRMAVEGRLGDEEYSSTVTVGTGSEGMQMGFMQFMTLGPIGITLFNPAAWLMMGGRELTLGDGWSQSSGGETTSVLVERTCGYAGQDGLDVIVRDNDVVMQESCVSPAVALPLRVMTGDDSSRIELVLAEYRP